MKLTSFKSGPIGPSWIARRRLLHPQGKKESLFDCPRAGGKGSGSRKDVRAENAGGLLRKRKGGDDPKAGRGSQEVANGKKKTPGAAVTTGEGQLDGYEIDGVRGLEKEQNY